MNARHRLPAWSRLAGPGLLLVAIACLQPWLEQTMARHMGLELPALFGVGWLAGRCAGPGLGRALAPWNANGLPGLLFAACVSGFWMVPAALDAAVLHAAVATAKVATVVAAGLLLQASWSSAGAVIQAFFVLNWFWMTLAAGLVYQEAPQQLCSVYRADEQLHAGRAMSAWAVVGLGVWLWRVVVDACRADETSQETAAVPDAVRNLPVIAAPAFAEAGSGGIDGARGPA